LEAAVSATGEAARPRMSITHVNTIIKKVRRSNGQNARMPDAVGKLTSADPADLPAALAYTLRYQGRKRVHNADELMAEKMVEHAGKRGHAIFRRRPGAGMFTICSRQVCD
jgi:hypothetical protein